MPTLNSLEERNLIAQAAKDMKDLYSACLSEEEELETKFSERKVEILGNLIFGPLFDPDPRLDLPASDTDSRELKIERAIWYGLKYQDLLKLLRGCKDNQARLLILARWLKQEGVCKPPDFLSKRTLSRFMRLARQTRLKEDVSFTDIKHSLLVSIWLPYFNRLMEDCRRFQRLRRQRQILEEIYDTQAVQEVMVRNRRSAIPVVCAWLEHRGKGEAPALMNAYSRHSRAVQKSHS